MRSLRIGLLLGWRQIQRANIWTTLLIIFVMTLTFLNLIAISGILVGLPTGAERAVKERSLGDIVITPLTEETYILQTEAIRAALDTIPEITGYTIRYQAASRIEANYQTRDPRKDRNIITTRVSGIDPIAEDVVTNLSGGVIEGTYLNANEDGYILIGALNIDRHTTEVADIVDPLKNVFPGDTVRVSIGTASKEFIVKGIVDAKGGEVANNVYMTEREFRRLANRTDRNADTIAIRINPTSNPDAVKAAILSYGIAEYATVRTFAEAMPKFIADIKSTFNTLGLLIGSIGLVVASITIFIIIFINAVSRRQQIGILKGIGMKRTVIEVAYVFQAALYALIGSAIGALFTYQFLIGYFDRNPINFPFSDGILVAPIEETVARFLILFLVTLIAGFFPAWLIVRQNTLNSILGRK